MQPLAAVPGGSGPAPTPVIVGFFVAWGILAILLLVAKLRRK